MTLGERLREARIKAGLTQKQVAEELNVSRQAVSGWENNLSQPDLQLAVRIADLYGVSIDAFVRNGPEPQVETAGNVSDIPDAPGGSGVQSAQSEEIQANSVNEDIPVAASAASPTLFRWKVIAITAALIVTFAAGIFAHSAWLEYENYREKMEFEKNLQDFLNGEYHPSFGGGDHYRQDELPRWHIDPEWFDGNPFTSDGE